MAGMTLSGCGGSPAPTPAPAPTTPQEAWDLYRDAFERRSISDLMNVFPEVADQDVVVQYFKERHVGDHQVPTVDVCRSDSFSGTNREVAETCYGDVLRGMVGGPRIIASFLDLDGSDPIVAFVWSGPGVDVAVEMIAWDEQHLVKWHQAYIKMNAEYGQEPDATSRATDVDADPHDPSFPWRGMDYQWNNQSLDALMGYFGNESKLLAHYGNDDNFIEEFDNPDRIRAFFRVNMNDLPGGSAISQYLRNAEGQQVEEAGLITTGIRTDSDVTGARLVTMIISPDLGTIKLQFTVYYNYYTPAPLASTIV